MLTSDRCRGLDGRVCFLRKYRRVCDERARDTDILGAALRLQYAATTAAKDTTSGSAAASAPIVTAAIVAVPSCPTARIAAATMVTSPSCAAASPAAACASASCRRCAHY